MEFNVNRSKGSGDMERTRKCYGRNDGQTDERTNGRTNVLTFGYFLGTYSVRKNSQKV